MNCRNCGSIINLGENMCRNCGTIVGSPVQTTPSIQNAQPTQPMMNNQPMNQPVQQMGPVSPMGQPMMNNQPKKNNNGLIIAVVAIIAVVVIVCAVVLTKDDSSDSSNNNNNGTSVAVSTTKVKYNGYIFNVPSDYMYTISNDTLIVGDNTTWQAEILVSNTSYDQIKANRTRLNGFSSNGITYNNVQTKTYNGTEWITIEVNYNGKNMILAYTKVSASATFGVTVYNKNFVTDYSLLEKVSPIFKGVTYEGTSHSMALDGNISFDGITESAINGQITEPVQSNSNVATQNSNTATTSNSNSLTQN